MLEDKVGPILGIVGLGGLLGAEGLGLDNKG